MVLSTRPQWAADQSEGAHESHMRATTQLLESMDADGDGKISLEEWMNYIETVCVLVSHADAHLRGVRYGSRTSART